MNELRKRLDPIGKKDLEAIVTLKNKDYANYGLPINDDLHIWDYRYINSPDTFAAALVDDPGPVTRYYSRLYVESNLSLNGSLVKEYFPVSFVVPAILNIYQNLLGVKFVEVDGETKDVWHPGESSPHPCILCD